MDNNFLQTIDSIRKAVKIFDSYNNELLALEFDHSAIDDLQNIAPLIPSRYDSFIFMGVSEGSMEVQIDYVNYVVLKNTFVIIMPYHITHFISGSKDYKGWVLSVSNEYMETLSAHSHPPLFISFIRLKKNPIISFELSEYQVIYSSFDFLRNKLRQQSNVFYDELVNTALRLFFIELGNLYIGQIDHFDSQPFSRHEEIFTDFQKLLLENCTSRHDVNFYAEQLCITPQYLSLILKEQSGMSASQWIQEGLIIEAKSMLKSPRVSIQQVSDNLHFPDQSTFGKFFKKHVGMSPLQFRKMHR